MASQPPPRPSPDRPGCIEAGCDRPTRPGDWRCAFHSTRLGTLLSDEPHQARPEPELPPLPAPPSLRAWAPLAAWGALAAAGGWGAVRVLLNGLEHYPYGAEGNWRLLGAVLLLVAPWLGVTALSAAPGRRTEWLSWALLLAALGPGVVVGARLFSLAVTVSAPVIKPRIVRPRPAAPANRTTYIVVPQKLEEPGAAVQPERP